MTAHRSPRRLLGRQRECDALNRLVDAVVAGESRVLVLRGEAGVGKSSMLEYAEEQAQRCRVVRGSGVESEGELAFAGLHQLCAPMLGRVQLLPEPQRDALNTAFGVIAGEAPDILLVGLAVLGLLSAVADEQPLVCLIDDAQWLDRGSAYALTFVARRLLADNVAMIFVIRDPTRDSSLDDLPQLVIAGLSDADANAVLDEAIPARMDVQVRERILAEANGNPLALMELSRAAPPSGLAGGFTASAAGPLSSRIEEAFQRRVRSMPSDGQVLLHLAAAEPVGDPLLLWKAAGLLGIGTDSVTAVEAEGLLEVGTRVRFPHPLMRSAAYRTATGADRRQAHWALAEATDPSIAPDRRAWHRAEASFGPDEALARELEQSAARARSRGGAAAAAAFLRRATELTPDPERRGERALSAAAAKLDAGAPDLAAKLLATAEMCPLDEVQQADALRLRARIAFAERRGSDAPPLLLDAARRLEPLDPALARETYLDTLGAAIFAGRCTTSPTMGEVAAAAREAPPALEPPRVIDLLVDGLATRYTEGYVAAVEPFWRTLEAIRADDQETDANLPWLWMACRIAACVWDDETWEELADRQLRLARESGALRALPLAATYRAGVHIHSGEFSAAAALIDESDHLQSLVGGAPLAYAIAVLLAWRGKEADLVAELGRSVPDATARGEGRGLTWADYTMAVLYNGLGQYPAALDAAQAACATDEIGVVNWALVELIEAAVHSDRPEVATAALDQLTERTHSSGTEWARGIEARSRALLSDGQVADDLFREAVERLGRTRVRVHLARTHLVYGEWLRRANRRADARVQLRAAHDQFVRFGADGFAARAQRELLATGETVRKRTVDVAASLTPQEAQIARLASDGHTNPEIGSRLFISPRTVEYHLRKVFTKLTIDSRRELASVLPLPLDPRSPA